MMCTNALVLTMAFVLCLDLGLQKNWPTSRKCDEMTDLKESSMLPKSQDTERTNAADYSCIEW